MGCFGYICPVCETQIVGDAFTGGELCRLKHIRHGELLGETVGHYDEYGSVIEDDQFRTIDREATHMNTHEEICTSEMSLNDSMSFGDKKLSNDGSIINTSYIVIRDIYDLRPDQPAYTVVTEALDSPLAKKYPNDVNQLTELLDLAVKYHEQLDKLRKISDDDKRTLDKLLDQFHLVRGEVPYVDSQLIRGYIKRMPLAPVSSGILAVHEKCWQSLTKEQQDALPFSLPDPNQSWGDVRDEYM